MASSTEKVSIVTGANKGIGYGIVEGLCKKFDGVVYLTARNKANGEAAVEELKKSGYSPVFYQLDVNDIDNIKYFRKYIQEKHGGIDILVNNAGVLNRKSDFESAKSTLQTNYFGVLHMCQEFFPLMRQNGRIVNLSSSSGHLSRIPSAELRSKLGSAALTIDELNSLMNDYVKSTADQTNILKGWGSNTYVVSKVGVSALTRVYQSIADREMPNRNLYINSVHPGFVRTDMTDGQGYFSIEEGAKAPLFLAIGEHQLRGRYIWKDCSDVDWFAAAAPIPH